MCVCNSRISLFAIFRFFLFIRVKKINWQISTFLLLITFIEGLFFLFHLLVAIFHLEFKDTRATMKNTKLTEETVSLYISIMDQRSH